MLISYIQSIMMIILEVICCKIFFESFAEKRSKNNYRNYSIILGIVVCEYVIASLFYDKFILKRKRSIASTFCNQLSSAIIVSHYTQSKKFST